MESESTYTKHCENLFTKGDFIFNTSKPNQLSTKLSRLILLYKLQYIIIDVTEKEKNIIENIIKDNSNREQNNRNQGIKAAI